MQTIVIYPGRFQLFGKHHGSVYKYLTALHGPDVYIATSNKVELPDSPFSFSEKLPFIEQWVPKNKIKLVKNPYAPVEILKDFNPEKTSVIFAYSAKDAGRLTYNKANGEPGYFKLYNMGIQLESYTKHGYVEIVPEFHIKFKGKDLSGTYIRQILKNMALDMDSRSNKRDFETLFGFFNKTTYLYVLNRMK